jgi:uncharacterized protein with HEPN domain
VLSKKGGEVQRSARLRLHDILDAIEGIEATVGAAGLAEYARSWTMRRAVKRGIEIIPAVYS